MKKQGKLLIVDDEVELISILKDLLTDIVDEIYTANNGEDGLNKLASNPVDLVLSDIKMPKMDGVEFIKHARERGLKTPFIFYTAHGNRELMMEVVQYDVFDFLSKPNLEALEESVARAMEFSLNKKAGVDTTAAKAGEIDNLLGKLGDKK